MTRFEKISMENEKIHRMKLLFWYGFISEERFARFLDAQLYHYNVSGLGEVGKIHEYLTCLEIKQVFYKR